MKRQMLRLFLIGTLFGAMITAAVTYVFAIPANERSAGGWRFGSEGASSDLRQKWPCWLEMDGRPGFRIHRVPQARCGTSI